MRKKLFIGSFLALSALAVIPAVAISCSSNSNDHQTNDDQIISSWELNFTGVGIPASQQLTNVLAVSQNSDNKITDLGIYTNITSYHLLKDYLIITNPATGNQISNNTFVKIEDPDVISNVTTQTINLGMMGKIVGIWNPPTETTSEGSWTYTFYSIQIPTTVKQLEELIETKITDLPDSLLNNQIIINYATQKTMSEDISASIHQIIWIKSSDSQNLSSNLNLGAIVGTYQTKPIGNDLVQGWSWTYNSKLLPIENGIEKAKENGIPEGYKTISLGSLSLYLKMPWLYQYAMSNSFNNIYITKVTSIDGVPTQSITIFSVGSNLYNTYDNINMIITGTWKQDVWSYDFILSNNPNNVANINL